MILRIIAIIFLLSGTSFAAYPWSTTFNCTSDTTGYYGIPCPDSSGASFSATGSSACGGQLWVLQSGNYPNGGGYRGFRTFEAGCGVGCSSIAASPGWLRMSMSPATSEMWLRFYIRWGSGFMYDPAYNNYGRVSQKLIYVYSTSNKTTGMNMPNGMNGAVWGSQNITPGFGSGLQCNVDANCGWDAMYLNGTGTQYTAGDGQTHRASDGSWHKIKVHWGGSPGIYEYWLDDVLKARHTNLDYNGALWNNYTVPENGVGIRSGCTNIDVDDIKFDTVDPDSGVPVNRTPNAPTNLRIQ